MGEGGTREILDTFFNGTMAWVHSLVHAKQVLYHLRHL
jgi:hypothetical protein